MTAKVPSSKRMKSHEIYIDDTRWRKLKKHARDRKVTVSNVLRVFIDSLTN